jgi:hypothetical protein
MPAKYVRLYSKGQTNDFRDAEAIAEAVQRPTMRFVATKSADQLDFQALHRVRERLVGQRTGIINQIRAFLLERGVAVRQGLRFLRAELPTILAIYHPTRTAAEAPGNQRFWPIKRCSAHARRIATHHPTASCPIEHPFGRFQTACALLTRLRAAQHACAVPLHRFMNEHHTAKPRMPGIKNFPFLDPVGIILSSCTTGRARTWPWARMRRWGELCKDQGPLLLRLRADMIFGRDT